MGTRMQVGDIGFSVLRGDGYAAVGTYPIIIKGGDLVAITEATIRYQGPLVNFYLCWGIRAGTGNFNNGDNLLGGATAFAWNAIRLLEAVSYQSQSLIITSPMRLTVPLNIPVADYGCHVWVSSEAGPREAATFFKIRYPPDSGIFRVLTAVPPSAVDTIEVVYAKM